MNGVPEHVAIIPDGNRRFATRLMSAPWKGHEWGVQKMKEVFEWSKELGIRVITLYSLSLENLDKRPELEIKFLLNIARGEFDDIIKSEDNFVHKNKIKVSFFGRLDLLPQDVRERMEKVVELTKDYNNYFINFAIAYGGRQEIIESCRLLAEDVKEGRIEPGSIDESYFRKHLQTGNFPDPDLVIRTGGERRISNFLPFQCAYSELAFIDNFWPDMEKEEFFNVINDFTKRDRRFGR